MLSRAIILASLAGIASGSSCLVDDSSKTDCGYDGVTESSCTAKGCCWLPVYNAQNSSIPWCFNAGADVGGYTMTGLTETATGYTATLSLVGSGSTTYGPDIQTLAMSVIFESEDTFRIKITDSENARWEIPQSVLSRPEISAKPTGDLNYKFTYTESPFSFEVTRNSDGKSLFKSSSLVFKDQYIELGTHIDSTATTFGVGESARTTQPLEPGSTYTLWAADVASYSKDTNLYGSFPYYVQVVDGTAHGALLLNSNGMDVSVGSESITFKAIGGIVDLYVFSGSSPVDVVTQYTDIVGKPTMMPYWSLGFHNCKYGYESVAQVEQVVANYSAAGIPLDTQWMGTLT